MKSEQKPLNTTNGIRTPLSQLEMLVQTLDQTLTLH